MERPRRVSFAGISAVALAVALAVPALAAPGTADLVARGPVALDGRTAVQAAGGHLLVQDPRNQGDLADLQFSVFAEEAVVTLHELRQDCWAAGPQGLVRVASVDGLPARLGLARLEDAPTTVAGTVDGVLDGVLTRTQAGLDLPALPAVPVATGLTGSVVAPLTAPAGADPAPSLPVVGNVACLSSPQDDTSATFEVRQLQLNTLGASAGYGALFRAHDGDEHPGSAVLQANAAELRYQRSDETVRLVGSADPWRMYDPVASEVLPGHAVRASAERGTGSLFGSGTLWLYNLEVGASGVEGTDESWSQTFRTGPEGEGENRVLRFLQIQLSGASGSFSSPGEVMVQAPSLAATLDGTMALEDATGEARVADEAFTFDREATALTGKLAFDAAPLGEDAHGREAKEGALRLRGQGEVSSIQGAGPFQPQEQQSTVTTAAAVVSAAAIAAGIAAWFWPALKWLVAPLYTRIPKDTLLMHDARERIFKLIREEPGIHAHEVAARLDLGWGTAVYHLKLLERNGLVVSRHEGRYKRFFVTGDQRIQVKDAVALLRNPTSRSIAAQVARQPGLIQKQVCEALGLSPSLASWHLQRLEAAQVVRAERLGRAVRYIPGQAWTELQELDAALKPTVPITALPAQAPPQPPTLPGAA